MKDIPAPGVRRWSSDLQAQLQLLGEYRWFHLKRNINIQRPLYVKPNKAKKSQRSFVVILKSNKTFERNKDFEHVTLHCNNLLWVETLRDLNQKGSIITINQNAEIDYRYGTRPEVWDKRQVLSLIWPKEKLSITTKRAFTMTFLRRLCHSTSWIQNSC